MTAPSSGSNSVTVPQDGTYTFTLADFTQGYSDANGDTFAGIYITSMRSSTNTILQLTGASENGVFVSAADIAAGLLKFSNTDIYGDSSFSFHVVDSAGEREVGSSTMSIDVLERNGGPSINLGHDEAFLYAESSDPDAHLVVSLLPLVTFTDDNSSFAGGTLTLGFAADATAGDQFRIANLGTGAGQISTIGTSILYGGKAIGTFSGGTDGSNLVVTFSVAATAESIQALLRSITYHNDAGATYDGERTILFTIVDGGSEANGGDDESIAYFPFHINTADDHPTGADNAEAVAASGTYTFTSADFGYGDVEGDAMAGIHVNLPTHGRLVYDPDGAGPDAGETIWFDGFEVSKADLDAGRLSYVADGGSSAIGLASFSFTVFNEGWSGYTADPTPNVFTFNVGAAPVAQNDLVSTVETSPVGGNLFANNGSGADSDADGTAVVIASVNGQVANVGSQITLASGALLTVNANGTFAYHPNGKFAWVTTAASGAVNTTATETFTYRLAGSDTDATVTITINGGASSHDELRGDLSNNTITGSNGVNAFRLQQGGNDTVSGLDGNDTFYFGSAFAHGDVVDGGAGGSDTVVLQGTYNLTFGANAFTGVEVLSLRSATDATFGDFGGIGYSYNISTDNYNVAAGAQLRVEGQSLVAGENLTFNGSAELTGKFLIFGGHGIDDLTGGGSNDFFYFIDDRFGYYDRVDGGAGTDTLTIRGIAGLNSIVFGANQLTSIETITFNPALAGGTNGLPSYALTLNDGNVAAATPMIINATFLTDVRQTIYVDGRAEADGLLRFYGGAGNDYFIGGGGADIFWGGGGQDTVIGGGGADQFQLRDVADSLNKAPDKILDFTAGTDKIHLSSIDANFNAAGDQAFVLGVGNTPFTAAGQLRAYDSGLGYWIVQGEVNGDGLADFTLHVTTGSGSLLSSDFIL